MANASESSATEGNPLLPVVEVARRLGVSNVTVAGHVLHGGLRALDQGELIAAGDFNTPLIREQEMERFTEDLAAALQSAPKPMVPDNPIESIPFLVGYAFVMALAEGDIEKVWEASSQASREAFETARELAAWWSDYLGIKQATEPGVASGLYPIADGAVALMYIADTPPSGGIVARGTVTYSNPLALVEDPDGWRVDQPMQARCKEWRHLAGGPQPSEVEAEESAKTPN